MIPLDDLDARDDWQWPHDVLSDVVPDERIGVPLPRSRKRRGLRRLGIAALLAGAGYAVTTYNPDWISDVTNRAHALASAVIEARGKAAGGDAAPAPSPSPSEALPQAASLPDIAGPFESPSQAKAPELPVRAVSETPPVAATAYTPEAEPPEARPGDTVARAQAVKAGLGPDLPNILLARLSKADLENAAYAIKTALSKTAETAVLSWPPKPSAQQALFEVRFVAGASEGCRRYVVTVTKEHWSMTSGAVETCPRDQRP